MKLLRLALCFVALVVLAALIVSILATNDMRRRVDRLEGERSLLETRHGAVEYKMWGDGPPVLVIHGAGGGFDQGRLLAETLGGEGATWIAVSRFGYLGSALPDDSSPSAQAAAFAALLDALGVERVSLLAMSGGVPPALKFAELYPQRTDRMVLLSSAPFTPFNPDIEDRPIPSWLYAAMLGNDVVYWTLTRLARRQLEAAFDARPELLAGASQAEKDFVSRLVDGFSPSSRRLAGVNNEIAAVHPEMRYNVELIEAPVLLVHARDDRLNPYAVAETLAARLPDVRFVTYESGGHLLLGRHDALQTSIEAVLSEP